MFPDTHLYYGDTLPPDFCRRYLCVIKGKMQVSHIHYLLQESSEENVKSKLKLS